MLHTNGAKQIRDIINIMNNTQEHKLSNFSSLVIIITFLIFSPKITKKADTSKDTRTFQHPDEKPLMCPEYQYHLDSFQAFSFLYVHPSILNKILLE